jgi:hypothetical protein
VDTEASNGESIHSLQMRDVEFPTFPLDFPYSIKNWPCTNDASKAALEELESTHHLIPVPAYKYEGSLMYPQYYKQMLTSTVIEVHFTLTHWSIGAKPTQGQESINAYTPELFAMHVLRKLLPSITSPHKRKVLFKDPLGLESPMKKTNKST